MWTPGSLKLGLRLCALGGLDDKGSQVRGGVTAVPVLVLGLDHVTAQPLGPGHFDSLIPGLRFAAVAFPGCIVAE